MATKKPEENDATLPFSALQLLAPPVRLVSAALWKVMKQRDVMQYGTVEEFVTSACDTVPGLLTYRHQGKLALGLRARLILELCRGQDQPDPKVIAPHLKRICSPAPSSTSGCKPKRDIKIEKTVISFQELVQTLLRVPAERKCFFKEEFPVDYGPQFDQELEKLLWEFLIRLDQLLPVPNLAQTVSWLSFAPPVLEECARAATQPQLLKILLQHQTCLGHLDSAASLPPCMGDSILTSLSLPLSGRAPSNPPSGHPKTSSPKKSSTSGPAPETDGHKRTRDASPFITPVIGLMSNEDVPIMYLANKRRSRGDQQASSSRLDEAKDELQLAGGAKFPGVRMRQNAVDDDVREVDEEVAEKERTVCKRSQMKRKQPDEGETESEEEEMEVVRLTRSRRRKQPNERETELEEEEMEVVRLARSRKRKQPNEWETESEEEEMEVVRLTSSRKRKQPNERETESEEEEMEVVRLTRNGRKSMGNGASPLRQGRRVQSGKESEEDCVNGSGRDEESEREALRSCMTRLGLKGLKLPEDPSLRSILISCLLSQPKILLARHPVTSVTGTVSPVISYDICGCREEKALPCRDERRRMSPVLDRVRRKQDSNPMRLEVELPSVADKENCAALSVTGRSSSCQRTSTETFTSTGDGEDIIVDSEDEGTKNFKGRLFVKRYYKTKNDTYIPTLREFWKPRIARRDLLSPGNGHR